MRRRRGRLTYFQAGLVGIVLVVIVTYFGFSKKVPFVHHYTVHAVFANANNVKPNAPVRIAGINVGKVSAVRLIDPRHGSPAGVVDMQIQDNGLPLHADARFKLRERIFLEGNEFVDVSPGSPGAPVVGDGHTFPINQTAAPVQLDQILTTLQHSTRTDLQTVLKELDKGFADGGAAGYRRSIPYWVPAYKNSAIVSDATLGTEPHDLSHYINTSGAVAQALDTYPQQLKSLVSDFNTTAHAFAVRQAQLSSAIFELPRTLSAGLPALAAVNRALPPTDRLARAFLPAVKSSGPAIDVTLPLITQLRGLVSKPELRGLIADLRPTVPSLAKLNAASVPLYEQTRLASSCQNNVILPWSHDTIQDPTFPAKGNVYEESTKFLPGVTGESRAGDANGQWQSVLLSTPQVAYPSGVDVNGAPRFLFTAGPLLGANPPPPAERSPLKPNVPCETQQPPDLRTIPLNPGQGIPVSLPNTPLAQARYQKAKQYAEAWLAQQLQAEHLDNILKVGDTDVTPAQIPHLRALGAVPPLPSPAVQAANRRAAALMASGALFKRKDARASKGASHR